jgi:hypothetical protein
MDKAEFIKYYLAPLMWALDPDIEEIRLIERPSSRQLITIKHKGSISREIADITNKSNEAITFDAVMFVLKYLDNKRRNPPLGQA